MDEEKSKFELDVSELSEVVEAPKNVHKDVIVMPNKGTEEENIEIDYNYVRNNLYTLTEKSISALETLSQIAEQSQHPRSFEVLAQLSKNIADSQMQILQIHKDMKKLQETKPKEDSSKVVNNNLFVGTTSQLDELIKKITDGKE